jgi:hypothetical protein|tara:strand:- start:293 stop:442 length:150 start_codon:yes stop_codon:yes gene_type:complete
MSGFGYEYPAGAANDPNAPWNQQVCDRCGYEVDSPNEDGICEDCAEEES